MSCVTFFDQLIMKIVLDIFKKVFRGPNLFTMGKIYSDDNKFPESYMFYISFNNVALSEFFLGGEGYNSLGSHFRSF